MNTHHSKETFINGVTQLGGGVVQFSYTLFEGLSKTHIFA